MALCFHPQILRKRLYNFSINSLRHANFTNLSGESAEVLKVQFRTSGDGCTPTVSRSDNQKALNKLRDAINNKYSYMEPLKPYPEVFLICKHSNRH